MLKLKLLIRLGWNLDLVPNTVVRFSLNSASNDIVCEESFVYNPIVRPGH